MSNTTTLDPEPIDLGLEEDIDLTGPAPSPVPPKPSFWHRPLVVIAAVILVILGILYGATILVHAMTHESTDDAFIDGRIVSIAPKVEGKVIAVNVRDNQFVKKGDSLVNLDPRDAEAALAQKQAALEVAQAKRENAQLAAEQAKAHVDTLQAAYAAAAANADAAKADAAKASGDLKRNRQLIAGGAISQQDLEHSTIDTASAKATLNSKEKQLEAARAYETEAKKSAGSAVAESSAAAAEVKQAQAVVRQAQLQLSYTKIAAPVEGRVTTKAVEAGDYVQVGQALMAIVPREVWVTANFKETQLALMRPGQPVEVAIDSYGRAMRAHVDSIQAGSGARFSLLPPENATGNFVKVVQRVPVKIVFDEQPGDQFVLGPGMSVVPDVKVKSSAGPIVTAAIVAAIAIFLVITGAFLWQAKSRQA